MPAALSKDMRWRVVKKSYMDEKSVAEIVSDLDVGSAFVKRVLKRFRETGDVATYQGQRLADVPCGR
jgi:transposase